MAGPAGAGKSTLTRSLGVRLSHGGAVVDDFGEEQLFTRQEFGEVGTAFRTSTGPSSTQLEWAYAAWLSTVPGDGCVVMDWNPASMAGDLPWARGDVARFRSHLEQVWSLTPQRAVVLSLEVRAELAVHRAGEERGGGWLTRYDSVARAAGHVGPDRVARIVGWTRAHMDRTAGELDVAASAGALVRSIDATDSADGVLRQAIDSLGYRRSSRS